MRRYFVSLLLLLVIAAPGPAFAQSEPPPEEVFFQRDRLVIETLEGERFGFTVELAVTPKQQARGLMYRRGLAPDAGMLFLTDSPREVSMWMKNTFIPLDMLFVDADGIVVTIASNTTPQSLDTISSGRAVKAVLEINGGLAEQLGVTEGARLLHPAFE